MLHFEFREIDLLKSSVRNILIKQFVFLMWKSYCDKFNMTKYTWVDKMFEMFQQIEFIKNVNKGLTIN